MINAISYQTLFQLEEINVILIGNVKCLSYQTYFQLEEINVILTSNIKCLSYQTYFQVEEINDDFDDMDEDIESFRCTC